MAIFHYLYLGLGDIKMSDDELGLDIPTPKLSRQEFLARIFAVERNFKYFKSDYAYVPLINKVLEIELSDGYESKVVFGKIGRKGKKPVGLGPEHKFSTAEIFDWRSAYVFVDISAGSQIVAIETSMSVNFRNVLNAMIQDTVKKGGRNTPNIEDEETLEMLYQPSIGQKYEDSMFWEAARDNQGHIGRLTFEFLPPNGIEDTMEDIKSVIAEIRNDLMGGKTSITTEAVEGRLDFDSELLKEVIKYLEKGGGASRIYNSDKKKVFDSEVKGKPEANEVSDDELVGIEDNELLLVHLSQALFDFVREKTNEADNT